MEDHRDDSSGDPSLPPWEQPGCFRMDCEPHRGELLTGLAIAALLVSQGSMCLPVLLLIGIPLQLITGYLASLDLAKMSKGMMDPDGQRVTGEARQTAWFALALGLFWGMIWATFLGWTVFRFRLW